MTQAIKTKSSETFQVATPIQYQVAMPHPETHLFEVTLHIRGWSSDVLDVKMPVWTPGSYLVREYARHLQDFTAAAATPEDPQDQETPLSWNKASKNHWQIQTEGVDDIRIRYRVYANELTVRTNHLDLTHGYFNPAALCLYVPQWQYQPVQIRVVPPYPHWRVTTPLETAGKAEHTYQAPDFDTLVDSPFEVGNHASYEFEVLGKSHELAIWGQGNADPHQVIEDTKKIIQTEAQIYGGLPYDRYIFLLHQSGSGFGGLEHKNSCSLNYPRLGFQVREKYERFMQLVAHEFFHLWNVKRIRPKELETFDYEQENYTPSLWFCEGATSYYDLLIPWRAGIYSTQAFLDKLSKDVTRFLNTPGRQVQPVSESSFDAWIKLYRRDANSDNSQISYYLKGELVCLLLDLLIRQNSNNQRSLDTVMRSLWDEFGKSETGYTAEQLQNAIAQAAGTDMDEFFQRYIHGTEELPLDDYLHAFGLRIQPEDTTDKPPRLGLTAATENGKETIKFVELGSPAQQAGIDANDELVALDGFRVNSQQLPERLQAYQPGDQVQLTVFHEDELRTCTVTLGEPQPSNYQIEPLAKTTREQQENFSRWLGIPIDSLNS